MAARNRLTDLGIANAKAADRALLNKTDRGWAVELCNGNKCLHLADKHGDPVVYTAKSAATRSLQRHNPKIEIEVKPQF